MKRDTSWTWTRSDSGALGLRGRNAIVVGGTGGIGRALARRLASQGAHVSVVGQTFRDADVPNIQFFHADLSLMAQARSVAQRLPAEEADLVIFTTGIFAAPKREETSEGIERDLAVSYLSRLVILREIAPKLAKSKRGAKPRVFIMGFPGAGESGTPEDLNATGPYDAMRAHMNTVAGNEALVLDAAQRYPKIAVFGLNPGLMKTDIRRNYLGHHRWRFRLIEGIIGALTPSPDTYAKRITPLLVAPDLDAHSGAMFDRKGRPILASPKLTPDRVKAILAASDALLPSGPAPTTTARARSKKA